MSPGVALQATYIPLLSSEASDDQMMNTLRSSFFSFDKEAGDWETAAYPGPAHGSVTDT